MKTHMLFKKMHAWRIAFFALIMIATSVLIPLSGLTSSTANAITADQCYLKFNGKEINPNNLSTQERQDFNDCKAINCKDAGAGAEIDSRKISCTNPSAVDPGVVQNAADAEVKPLLDLVCGSNPPAGEAAQGVYVQCRDDVRGFYETCNTSGGGITGETEATPEAAAICVRNKLPNPKPAIEQIKSAILKGRADSQGIIDTEIKKAEEERKKKECEADGGTWENSKCTPAAEDKPTCNVESVGWLVCPTVNFLSNLVDGSYAAVSSLLTVQPLVVNDANNGIYKAWTIMRNFSNVAFVISFLVIIFSQVTSVGVSNYGIKKLLPKLIIAAVLVNVSYWLCAILVDLSNIVGGSVKDLFNNITQQVVIPDPSAAEAGGVESVLGLAGIAATLLVTTGIVLYIGLSALIPMLILAVTAIVTVFLVLVVRQALIILLIVVSPLAFVAFLLPNTESLFKKWKGLFQTLLIMYPVIALIFGASSLASAVIMAGASGKYKIVTQITGAAIAVIPPAAIVFFIKSISGVLGKVGAFVNNPKRGPIDWAKRSAKDFRGYRQNVNQTNRRRRARGEGGVGEFASSIGKEGSWQRRSAMWLAGSGVTAGMNQKRKYSSAEAVNKSDEQSYVANRALTDEAYAQHITAPTGSVDMTKAYSIEAVAQEWKKDVAAAKAIFEHEGTPFQDLSKQIKEGQLDGDPAKKNAAMQRYFELANSDGVQDMIEHLGQLGTNNPNDENVKQLQKTAAESLASSPMKPVDLSGSNLSKMKTGNFTASEAERITDTVSDGKTTAQHIAKMDVDEMRRWGKQLTENGTMLQEVGPEKIEATFAAIAQAESDPRLNVGFGDREKEALATLKGQLQKQLAVSQKYHQDAAYKSYEDAGNIR